MMDKAPPPEDVLLIISKEADLGQKGTLATIFSQDFSAHDYIAFTNRSQKNKRRKKQRSEAISSYFENKSGIQIYFSPQEFKVIRPLFEKPHHILSREDLLDASESDEETFNRCIDMHISRIRKKLKNNGFPNNIIESISGGGYIARIGKIPPPKKGEKLDIQNDAYLDLRNWEIVNGEKRAPLTESEFKVAYTLFRRPEIIKTKKELLKAANSSEKYSDTHMRKLIERIRKRLENVDLDKNCIETVRGEGFRAKKPTLSIPLTIETHQNTQTNSK